MGNFRTEDFEDAGEPVRVEKVLLALDNAT